MKPKKPRNSSSVKPKPPARLPKKYVSAVKSAVKGLEDHIGYLETRIEAVRKLIESIQAMRPGDLFSVKLKSRPSTQGIIRLEGLKPGGALVSIVTGSIGFGYMLKKSRFITRTDNLEVNLESVSDWTKIPMTDLPLHMGDEFKSPLFDKLLKGIT